MLGCGRLAFNPGAAVNSGRAMFLPIKVEKFRIWAV